MSKAIAGLRGLNAIDKAARASVIHGEMSGNPNFQSPSPSMAEFGQAIMELEEANIAALDRGRMAIARRNLAEEKITLMITGLAGYVNSVCLGDTVKILSSGFNLAKEPEPIAFMGAPQGAKVRRTALPSQLVLSWDRVPGTVIYEVEESLTDAAGQTNWQRGELTSRPKLVMDGRRGDIPHRFRIRAIGTNVASPYTEVFYTKVA